MENNRHVGDDANTVGKESFTHISPDTGKCTAWTVKLNCEAEGGADERR